MNVADLFVNLGIKGSEKTVGALSSVTKGLGGIKDMSLEAKAGIAAALYGLERLVASSGAAGTGLTNFTALTKESAKTLQQYQYAGRQVGISNQEMEGTFKTLQNTITQVLSGKGAPAGWGRITTVLGGMGDITELQKHPELLIQKLQEYAQKEQNAGLRNANLKSFGLGDNVTAGLARNAFTPGVLNKAPTYSDREIGQLDKANIAWSNLGNSIEMAIGHFNAKHGVQLVQDITKITAAVVHLVEALDKVAEKYGIFEKFGKVLNLTAEALESKPGTLLGETHYEKKAWNWAKDKAKNAVSSVEGLFAPSAPHTTGNSGSTQNVDINQTVIFQNPDHAPKKTADSLKKAAGDYVKQTGAKVQGT